MENRKIPKLTLGLRMLISQESAGLTSGEMAKRLKVSRHSVSGWLHSRHQPNNATLMRWASICDVDEDWLINGEEGLILTATPSRQQMAEMLVAALMGADMGDKPTGLSLDELYLRPEEPNWVVPDYIDLTAEPPRVVQMIDAA